MRDVRTAAYLLLAPACTLLFARWPGGEISPGIADAIAFVTGVTMTLVPLALAAPARAGRWGTVLLVALGVLPAAAWWIGAGGPPPPALGNLALVTVAHLAGGAVGRRVEH